MKPDTTFRFATLFAVLVFVSACDSATPDDGVTPIRPLTSSEQAVVVADQAFGLDLLSTVNEAQLDSNVVTAPLSVSMALGMATNGAATTTLEQMLAVLSKDGLTEAEINDAYKFLLSVLPSADEHVAVKIANSVWYRDGFEVSADYLSRVSDVFQARVASLDFASDDAPDTINDWVSENTNGLIPQIIEQIPDKAVAYLINAVYFKGSWRYPFDPDDTVNDTFHNLDGTSSPVRMMNYDGVLAQYQTSEYSAIDIPYGDSLFSMTVLLPAPSSDVNELIASFDSADLAEIVAGLQPSEVPLSLPRFTVEYSTRLDDALKLMGMPDAFDESAADFRRINSAERLFISSVVHKTLVAVTEEGTEAAAATSVEVGVTSLPTPFRVDRPFVFLIRERVTGTLLFTGKIVNL